MPEPITTGLFILSAFKAGYDQYTGWQQAKDLKKMNSQQKKYDIRSTWMQLDAAAGKRDMLDDAYTGSKRMMTDAYGNQKKSFKASAGEEAGATGLEMSGDSFMKTQNQEERMRQEFGGSMTQNRVNYKTQKYELEQAMEGMKLNLDQYSAGQENSGAQKYLKDLGYWDTGEDDPKNNWHTQFDDSFISRTFNENPYDNKETDTTGTSTQNGLRVGTGKKARR